MQTSSRSYLLRSDHSNSKKHYVTDVPLQNFLAFLCSDLREWKFDELQSSQSDQLYSHSPFQREERK